MSRVHIKGGREGRKVTLLGAVANSLLIACKFTAGILGNSQAMVVDAVHSISDLFTDAVVLVGLQMGRKDPDDTHHFGHARIATMASAVVGVSLMIVAAYLGYGAGRNIYYHTEYHPTWLALAGACLSIAVKETLYRYTLHVGLRIKSQAVVANAWHHRSDAFSSVAVLIGVAGAQLRPQWHILDAYAALVVSLFIMKVGFEVLWRVMREMADTAPGQEVLERIMTCARGVTGVLEAHDLKVRSMGGLYQMQIHIKVDGGLTVAQGHHIAKQVEECLNTEIKDIGEIIVHVDPAETGKNHGTDDP